MPDHGKDLAALVARLAPGYQDDLYVPRRCGLSGTGDRVLIPAIPSWPALTVEAAAHKVGDGSIPLALFPPVPAPIPALVVALHAVSPIGRVAERKEGLVD